MKHDSASSDYWLYQWMDDREIRKAADLRKALRSQAAVDRLIELREDRTGSMSGDAASLDASVIASRRIDLSGYLGCNHFECIVPQIDILFSKTWHYFDTMIGVDDPDLPDPETDFSEFANDLQQRVKIYCSTFAKSGRATALRLAGSSQDSASTTLGNLLSRTDWA